MAENATPPLPSATDLGKKMRQHPTHQELARRLFILLASTSPRRSNLLEIAGFRFQVFPSHAEEIQAEGHNVERVVVENARLKGLEVLHRLVREGFHPPSGSILLAADTLVSMDGKVYGKPTDLLEAAAFLRELGGRPHRVLTGVFLYDFDHDRRTSFLETTSVTLKVLEPGEIENLFRRVTPLDKAAAYGFQDAPEIVDSLEGSETNVIGLPMSRLFEELWHLLYPEAKSPGESKAREPGA